MSLPSITIVTPNFNQASYLEQTIRSVLSQGYPNLQYGIVDGGSTDRSHQIIDRYRRYLDFAICEKNGGQSKAINKELRNAAGDILGWLNSDGTLCSAALRAMSEWYATPSFPASLAMCCGSVPSVS